MSQSLALCKSTQSTKSTTSIMSSVHASRRIELIYRKRRGETEHISQQVSVSGSSPKTEHEFVEFVECSFLKFPVGRMHRTLHIMFLRTCAFSRGDYNMNVVIVTELIQEKWSGRIERWRNKHCSLLNTQKTCKQRSTQWYKHGNKVCVCWWRENMSSTFCTLPALLHRERPTKMKNISIAGNWKRFFFWNHK